MCVECEVDRISRRSFLGGAAAAIAGVGLGLEAAGQQESLLTQNVLNDPNLIFSEVSFQSGRETIGGFVARPKKAGRRRAVVIAHGDPGVPEDIKYTAARVAQAGFVGLVYDWGSRSPLPSEESELKKWRDLIFTYGFIKLQLQDVQASIDYLHGQTFVRRERAGLIGFCGGGRLALLFASQSPNAQAVVSFYGPAAYHSRRHPTDPAPDLIEIARQITVPLQGHYGILDTVARSADAKLFAAAVGTPKKQVEMFYYEQAGHSFCNFTRPPGSNPGFDHNPEAAMLAHRRALEFLKRQLK